MTSLADLYAAPVQPDDTAEKKQQSATYWAAVDRLIKNTKKAPDPAQYPRYDPQDFPLYAEAAYGTPLDAYINGDAARGPVTPLLSLMQTPGPHPKAIQSTPETKDLYARLLAYSLRNPVTALGASDPSKVGLRKDNPRVEGVNFEVLGYYSPNADVGEANVDRQFGTGVLPHEFTHRGLSQLRPPGFYRASNASDADHLVMMAQDDQYRNNKTNFPHLLPGVEPVADDMGRKQLEYFVRKAQEEIATRLPYGGPR